MKEYYLKMQENIKSGKCIRFYQKKLNTTTIFKLVDFDEIKFRNSISRRMQTIKAHSQFMPLYILKGDVFKNIPNANVIYRNEYDYTLSKKQKAIY